MSGREQYRKIAWTNTEWKQDSSQNNNKKQSKIKFQTKIINWKQKTRKIMNWKGTDDQLRGLVSLNSTGNLTVPTSVVTRPAPFTWRQHSFHRHNNASVQCHTKSLCVCVCVWQNKYAERTPTAFTILLNSASKTQDHAGSYLTKEPTAQTYCHPSRDSLLETFTDTVTSSTKSKYFRNQ